jgi:hypothetical protein
MVGKQNSGVALSEESMTPPRMAALLALSAHTIGSAGVARKRLSAASISSGSSSFRIFEFGALEIRR